MSPVMFRILALSLAFLLALPVLAHSDNALDCRTASAALSDDCQWPSAKLVERQDDTTQQQNFGTRVTQHCGLHCVAMATVFEFVSFSKLEMPISERSAGLFLQYNERIPRPPDVV